MVRVLECDKSTLFWPLEVFWDSFLDMAEILLGYITPFQASNWELHLRSLEKMLKWFYAYDYTYYAQNFTYCLVTQQNLGEQHPTIYGEFQKRNSGIKIAFILTRLLSKP